MEQFLNLLLGLSWLWGGARNAIFPGMIYRGFALVSFNSYPLFLGRDIGPRADFRQRYTKLPIIVKGVQSIEDVELCAKHGAEGVMIVSFTYPHGSLTPIDSPFFLQVKPRRSSSGLRSCAH